MRKLIFGNPIFQRFKCKAEFADKLVKIIVLAIDITASKKMQLKIKQANEEMLVTEEELRQNLEELQTTQENLSSA